MRPLVSSIHLGLLCDLVNSFIVSIEKIRIFSCFVSIVLVRHIASGATRFQSSRAFFEEVQLGTFERVFVLFGAVLIIRLHLI